MAMVQPGPLRVVSGGKIVEAEWMPSGVPGLALVGRPLTSGWRLVHIASGRAVSRSAEHQDPQKLEMLARSIGPLANWMDPRVAESHPELRERLDRAIAIWKGKRVGSSGASLQRHAVEYRTGLPEQSGPETSRVQEENLLLREALRRLAQTVPHSTFEDALQGLEPIQREQLSSMLRRRREEMLSSPAAVSNTDTTSVVQTLRRVSEPRTYSSRSGVHPTTAQIPVVRPHPGDRPPVVPDPNAAAS